jgi:hypothetical protein
MTSSRSAARATVVRLTALLCNPNMAVVWPNMCPGPLVGYSKEARTTTITTSPMVKMLLVGRPRIDAGRPLFRTFMAAPPMHSRTIAAAGARPPSLRTATLRTATDTATTNHYEFFLWTPPSLVCLLPYPIPRETRVGVSADLFAPEKAGRLKITFTSEECLCTPRRCLTVTPNPPASSFLFSSASHVKVHSRQKFLIFRRANSFPFLIRFWITKNH